MRTAINTSLTLLFFLTAFLSSAAFASSEETTCPIGVSSGYQTWDGSIYGNNPYLCLGSAGNCRYVLDTISVCSNVDGSCDGAFVSNGTRCTSSEGNGGNMMWPGGDFVDIDNGDGSDGGSDGDGSDSGDGSDEDTGSGDGEPDDSDNDTTEYLNRINLMCSQGLLTCSGELQLSSAITAYLRNIWQYAGYMNREGMPFIRDSLEHDIPQMISRNRTLVEDGNSANATALNSLNSAVSALSGNLQRIENEIANSVDADDLQSLHNHMVSLQGDMTGEIWNSSSSTVQQISGSMSSYFNAMMTSVNMLNYPISDINSMSRDTNARVAGLESGLQALSDDLSGVTQSLDGLSGDIVDGLADALDVTGVESRLDGIQSTLDGDGLSGRSFEGQVDFESNSLYSEGAIEELQTEIETLEEQYQEQMGQFKSLFSFDSSALNPGEYVEHQWQFHFMTGDTVNFSSGVFPALLSNANLIAAILLFIAVMAGIRALTD